MQNLVLSITGKSNHSIDDTVVSIWYRNGGSLPLASRLGSLKKPHLNISQSLTLENSSILDEGTYDALLTITHIHTLYLTLDAIVTTTPLLIIQSKLKLFCRQDSYCTSCLEQKSSQAFGSI